MSIFAGKTLMITGGTGSFGNAVLKRFLRTDIGEIRIFSRDEKKQDDMRHEYQAKYPDVAHKIKFYIGDVRSLESVRAAMPGTDYIFHAAALKQVPSCEFFPMEAVRTNVIGTDNVLTAAIECGVKSVICLSTDKAAYPINSMGITKAIEGEGFCGQIQTVRSLQDKDLLYSLWQCDVLPRFGHSSLDRPDSERSPHYPYGAIHDPLHYVVR